MPTYIVKAPGFYEGRLYDPNGKRKTLDRTEPFNEKDPMPSWLEKMPEESSAIKAKRLAAEKAQAELAKAKAAQDRKDIAAASSEGTGDETSFLSNDGAVETL